MNQSRSLRVRLVLGLALIGVAGCGSGAPPVESSTDEASVTGTVAINGKRVSKGVVVFDPTNVARKMAPVRSAEITAGAFSIQTLIGENAVRIDGPEAVKAGVHLESITIKVQPGTNDVAIDLSRSGALN